MDSDYSNPAARTGSMKRTLILILLAFLVGLGVTAWAATRWAPARKLLLGNAAVQPSRPIGAQPPPTVLEQAPTADLRAATPPSDASLMDDRINALESRMAQIGTTSGGVSSRAEGLLLAFAARRAIDRGLSLGYLEGALQQQFGMSQPRAVGVIIAAASQPVTVDALKDDLITIAPKLISRSPTKGWMDSIRDSVSGLIIVRKAGTATANPVDRLARAERMLDAGRVDVALTEVARLPGAQNGAAWMQSARRLVEAHRALDVLEAAAIMQPGTNPAKRSLPPVAPINPALRKFTTPETVGPVDNVPKTPRSDTF
jgi:hypothetical protein